MDSESQTISEQNLDRQFQPMWQVDESALENMRAFGEYISDKSFKIKTRISEYKIIDQSGKEEVVKADCAQMAAQTSSIKNPKAIIYLENVVPSIADKDVFEA